MHKCIFMPRSHLACSRPSACAYLYVNEGVRCSLLFENNKIQVNYFFSLPFQQKKKRRFHFKHGSILAFLYRHCVALRLYLLSLAVRSSAAQSHGAMQLTTTPVTTCTFYFWAKSFTNGSIFFSLLFGLRSQHTHCFFAYSFHFTSIPFRYPFQSHRLRGWTTYSNNNDKRSEKKLRRWENGKWDVSIKMSPMRNQTHTAN